MVAGRIYSGRLPADDPGDAVIAFAWCAPAVCSDTAGPGPRLHRRRLFFLFCQFSLQQGSEAADLFARLFGLFGDKRIVFALFLLLFTLG